VISKAKQEFLMRKVILETKKAIDKKDSPFAAFLVDANGKIIVKAHNSQITLNDRTAHSEIVLIRKACRKLKSFYLNGYSVFIVSEPCSMCSSLLIKARVDAIYYGAKLDKGNDPLIHVEEIVKRAKHKPDVYGGILEKECESLISSVR
jgi:tRNA(adenine34) deaminase